LFERDKVGLPISALDHMIIEEKLTYGIIFGEEGCTGGVGEPLYLFAPVKGSI